MMKKKRVISYGLIILIAAVLGSLFYRFSQPSGNKLSKELKEKAVSNLLGRKAEFSDTTPKGDKIFKGKTITFEYPAKAVVYEYRENSTSTESASLEDFSFDIKEPKLVFNLRVTHKGETKSVEDLPAVRLRESRLYEYKKAQNKLGDVNGVVYTKYANGGEKTGFWIVQDNIFTISVTGSNTEAIEELFKQILSSSEILN